MGSFVFYGIMYFFKPKVYIWKRAPQNIINIPQKAKVTENFERSKSLTIRAGNVWHDIQQVFYLMHENIEGCFAQKPLKSAKRIIEASSNKGDIVVDFFGHSGSTLLQAELSKR
ncbi:MAG: modification methylase protein, partial [Candidatus Moranbacteria bacterium GW2011_GWD2_38_7]